MNAAREQAERAADRIRSELVATMQELDRRRHRAMDLRYQLEKHFSVVVGIAAGAGLLAAGALLFAVMRARRENLLGERVRGLIRAWHNPQRIANSGPETSPATAAREVAMALAMTLATQFAKRGVVRLLPWNSAH